MNTKKSAILKIDTYIYPRNRKGKMTRTSLRRLLWVAVFGIAMGWFEAVLVVYLRLLYYPEGFFFPVKEIPMNILILELFREAATILMLIAVGWLAGRNKLERFGYFIYTFGIWDIIYYVGLKIALDWPESLITWDLLFLIPLPWIGPVLAPVLVSIAMILACVVIVIQEDREKPLSAPVFHWILEIICGLIIIFSFIIDFRQAITIGEPDRFRWEIFMLGYLPGIVIFLLAWRRTNSGK